MTDEEERRKCRAEIAARFAKEVATWSAQKLRAALAQPETVRAAEERECSMASIEKLKTHYLSRITCE